MKWLAALTADLARAAALLLAFAACMAGVAAWGGAFSVKLDSLTHLAPFGLAASLLAGGIWVLAGKHGPRATGPLALVGGLAWGLLMAPEVVGALSARHAPPGRETLKIVQFNIWARDDQPDRKLAWLKAQNPDVIVLEEVADAGAPLLSELAKTHPFHMTCENAPYPCSVVIFSKR